MYHSITPNVHPKNEEGGGVKGRAKKLLIEWATINKNELKKMWDSQEFHKLQPLD